MWKGGARGGEEYFVFGGCVAGVRACVVSRCVFVCVHMSGHEGRGKGGEGGSIQLRYLLDGLVSRGFGCVVPAL